MNHFALIKDEIRSIAFAVVVKSGSDKTFIPFNNFAKQWTEEANLLESKGVPEFAKISDFAPISRSFALLISSWKSEDGIIADSNNEVVSLLEKILQGEKTITSRTFSEKMMNFLPSTRRGRRRLRSLSKKEDETSDKQKQEALKVASMIGCRGVHKDKKGNWMPCSSHETMMRISNSAESDDFLKKKSLQEEVNKPKNVKKRGKRNNRIRGWEKLGSRGVVGIDGIDAGIVSAPVGGTAPAPTSLSTAGGVGGKSALSGPEYVRDNDPDVFLDPESARARSRQIGCVGISRRISKTGRAVWMPCTNMSDYARRSGSTALGRRGRITDAQREMRKLVRQEVSNLLKKK